LAYEAIEWSRPAFADLSILGMGAIQMSKARLRYPADFRRKIVEPARAGRSIAELAEEFVSARSRRFEIG